jgi:hypothetical protein
MILLLRLHSSCSWPVESVLGTADQSLWVLGHVLTEPPRTSVEGA